MNDRYIPVLIRTCDDRLDPEDRKALIDHAKEHGQIMSELDAYSDSNRMYASGPDDFFDYMSSYKGGPTDCAWEWLSDSDSNIAQLEEKYPDVEDAYEHPEFEEVQQFYWDSENREIAVRTNKTGDDIIPFRDFEGAKWLFIKSE